MAQTTQDTTLLSDTTGKEVTEQVVENGKGGTEAVGIKHADGISSSSPSVAVTEPQVEKTTPTSSNAQSTASSSHPSLVPLGSNHVQTSSITPVAPHPKRFSAVNINKKFLEKNTASGSGASSSGPSTAKAGSAASRPSMQPTSSHSRLVTTKLTASPAVTSSTAGWSRPSSVAPSPATGTNSPISTSPLPTVPVAQLSSTAAPQLPHAGKVILPQPRAGMVQATAQRDAGSTKPVWGNIKPPIAASTRLDIEPSDFPTAAEVANVASTQRKHAKALEEAKTQSESVAKQLRSEEADAFRGVHLDPNVHHWDEMEEDDDNFLDGVIEFGDGRQYKIETSESHSGSPSKNQGDDSNPVNMPPVSKEDRFVDDFDRSWPKSRNSPASVSRDVPPSVPHAASPSVSPAVSNSPVDSSRVLFNERSNRLEPYSQAQRPGQGPFNGKRGPHQDGESKAGSHNVQVLQKPPGSDFAGRNRRFSGSNNGFNAGPPNGFMGDRNREREQQRRDMPPPSPRLHRGEYPPGPGNDVGGRDVDRGRRTSMGPPAVPAHAAQRIPQDGGRQLPPHLSQVSPNIPTRRLPSRDSRFSPSGSSTGLPSQHSGRIPPHSPAISHSSLNLLSPAAGPTSTLPLSAPELDEARKDVMHTAAERAKQRRLQEEQEREAQKERARRKAAELEEIIKTREAEKAEKERQKLQEAEETAKALEKEKEVVSLIEDAMKSIDSSKPSGEKQASPDSRKLSVRPPPLKDVTPVLDGPRSAIQRRSATIPPRSVPPLSPALQTDSWRSRSNAVPPSPRQIQSRPPVSATFIASGPSAAEQVETIAGGQDDLEIVDFSDMGKFVGVPESSEVQSKEVEEELVSKPPGVIPRSARPVASDFFESTLSQGSTMPLSKKADFGVWRRKVSQEVNEPAPKQTDAQADDVKPTDLSVETATQESVLIDKAQSGLVENLPDNSLVSSKESLTHQDQGGQTVCLPQSSGVQRTPRAQSFYKESAMSSLDDAMSRIKGVLSGMHAQDLPKDVAPIISTEPEMQQTRTGTTQASSQIRPITKERWVPPARRVPRFDDMDEQREVFLFTVMQPPSPPHAPDDTLTVKFPSISRPVEFISRKQLQAFHRPPFQARMDILSFDPPVFDMNRRDLSLNDVLFRKPNLGLKTKFKYRVLLPRGRGPKVNIPSVPFARANSNGAFGRPTVADGASSWRKAVSPTIKDDFTSNVDELDTTSRSPPPNPSPPDANVAFISKSNESSPSKSDSNAAVRSRSQPKMPVGSAVAFIRDSRIDVAETDKKPSVNFIVGSELEEDDASSPTPTPNVVESKPEVMLNGITNVPSTSNEEQTALYSASSIKAGSSDSSADPVLVTPPTHHSSASWARSSVSLSIKESPARAPDPEHLKAVWSQTSDKAGLHAVNSLEGIADDLTALPFTLQDVKSEDGETPPPSLPSAPSRMSLHEVTRAFQTVPTSSTTPSQPLHRASFSPPSTNAPVARPATTGYPYSPAPQNNMRPYVSYATPIMNHSPAPVMYGHPIASSPVPARMQMNGHTPLYSQPMWVTMPGPSQPHNNMIRPMASPYPSQMMPYPSPAYATQPPPPNMMTPTTQQGQQNGASRGRGMPIMSPGVSHAHAHPGTAMYSSSPVMLHAVQVPQNHYMPVPVGRGQPPRADNGQISTQQPHTVNGHHPQTHNGFNPTQPYARPAW